MTKNYIHNFDSGNLEFCQICNSKDLDTILDLGYQPLADDLRPLDQKNQKTNYYPLKINLCRKCIMLQTSSIIEDETLYPKSYHYTPGISKQIRENFEAFAKKTKSLYELKSSDLILDIGCAILPIDLIILGHLPAVLDKISFYQYFTLHKIINTLPSIKILFI